jgi:hypothetical protein
MNNDDVPFDELGLASEPQPARAANQFSIRALLIATAIIAALCAIFFTMPAWVGGIFLSRR